MARPKKIVINPQGAVAIILSLSVGTCLVFLTAAALIDALVNHANSGLSAEYATVITSTLGTAVGGLVAFLGVRAGALQSQNQKPGEPGPFDSESTAEPEADVIPGQNSEKPTVEEGGNPQSS